MNNTYCSNKFLADKAKEFYEICLTDHGLCGFGFNDKSVQLTANSFRKRFPDSSAWKIGEKNKKCGDYYVSVFAYDVNFYCLMKEEELK